MKVKSIEVTNFKNIKHAEVQLNGKSVYVTGANGKGKTSFIQTVFTTLGAEKSPVVAIMEGENKAKVKLVIGNSEKEVYVEKVFTKSSPEGKLVVKSPEGEIYPKPATFIEQLIGSVSFDMEKFLSIKNEKDMLKFLKDFLKIDTEEIDEMYDEAYKARTEVNRNLKLKQAQLDGLNHVVKVDKPDQEKLNKEIAEYDDVKKKIAEIDGRMEKGNGLITVENNNIESSKRRIEQLKAEIANEEAAIEAASKKVDAYQETMNIYKGEKKAFEDTLAGMEDPYQKLSELSKTIAAHAEWEKKELLKKEVDDLENKSIALDTRVKELVEKKQDLFKSKNIAGISITEDGIEYMGLPLRREQINTARLAELAVDIILAVNPTLKIVKFDATPMDKETYTRVMHKIEEAGFQCFIEDVAKDGGELTIEVLEK